MGDNAKRKQVIPNSAKRIEREARQKQGTVDATQSEYVKKTYRKTENGVYVSKGPWEK